MSPLGAQTIVLLGAGASAEAGVPTTQPMTEALVEAIDKSKHPGHPLAQALHYVCGALMAYDSADGENPYLGPDVERVFAAVELLAERHTLEVSPFVSAWHPAVDGLDRRPAKAPGLFDSQFQSAITDAESHHKPSKLIIDLVETLSKASPDGATYAELARLMLSELRGLIAITPKASHYLDPLAEAARDRPLTVATLNYDLTVEHACRGLDVSCSTGISEWLAEGAWRWPEQGVGLLKLHGSIDWVWEREERGDGHLPVELIRVVEDATNERQPPALVFGQRGKLRAAGPFLSLLAEFERHLSHSKELLVIGYSFRDEHVNELIRRWSWEDINRTITVVDPDWPQSFRGNWEDFRAQLETYLVPSPSREGEFLPRLQIRREKCGAALRVLV